jgi:hypothetical protein
MTLSAVRLSVDMILSAVRLSVDMTLSAVRLSVDMILSAVRLSVDMTLIAFPNRIYVKRHCNSMKKIPIDNMMVAQLFNKLPVLY